MNGKVLPGDVHEHSHGILGTLFHGFIHPSGKGAPVADDAAIAGGRGAAGRALAMLTVAAAVEFAGAWFTGSSALVSNSVHALAGAVLTVPILVAAPRAPSSKQFTYGRDRAEDVAALVAVVVAAMLGLGALAWAIVRWATGAVAHDPILLGVAGVIGLLGYEIAAMVRLSAGRAIGSTTLRADGRRATGGGWTSLAVILAAFGVWFGYWWADPVIGVVIAVIVVRNAWHAAQPVAVRLLDGVEEDLTWRIARAAEEAGAPAITDVRARWAGHRLHAEVRLALAGDTTLARARATEEAVRDAIGAKFPSVGSVSVAATVGGPTTAPTPFEVHGRRRGANSAARATRDLRRWVVSRAAHAVASLPKHRRRRYMRVVRASRSRCSLRLAAQDVALSRRKQGFESPRERQLFQILRVFCALRAQQLANKEGRSPRR